MTVHMNDFGGIRRGNYFREEPIERAEVEVRVGKYKNGKAAVKDEITGEMIKCRVDLEAVSMAPWDAGIVQVLHLVSGVPSFSPSLTATTSHSCS